MAARPTREPLHVARPLPVDLAGCYLQSSPHPAHAGPLLSGIRLTSGHAFWHRAPNSTDPLTPLGPIPPLAASVWLGGGASAGCTGVLGGCVSPSQDRLAGGAGIRASVARPVRDRVADLWHTVAAYPGFGCAEHLVATPDGTILRSRPFSLPGAPLMASIALTERFIVIPELPVRHSRAAELLGLRFPYSASPDRRTSIGLLPRCPSSVAEPRWFTLRSSCLLHLVNAYEEGGKVVLDVVREETTAGLHRIVLCLASGDVRERPLAGAAVVSRALVDERFAGRRHRFVFTTSETAVTRHDLTRGDAQAWALDPGWRLGEPVFVPRARPVEGEGWLLVPAHHPASRRARLLVLDAADLDASPAAVHLPGPLPAADRATWLPAVEEPFGNGVTRSAALATGR